MEADYFVNLTSNFTYNDTTTASNDGDMYHFYFMLNGIVGSTICCIGILGNILNMMVLVHMFRRTPNSTTVFLLVMALSDLMVLVIYFIYDIVCVASPSKPLIKKSDVIGLEGTFAYFIYYIWYFPANIFIIASNWCIVSVMCFRFIAVYFPLHARNWCSVGRAKITVVVINLCSLTLSLPEFFTVYLLPSNGSAFIFDDTELYNKNSFNDGYYTVVETLNSVVPFIVCSLLSILLVRTLTKNNVSMVRNLDNGSLRDLPFNNRRKAEQRRISVTLLCITMWFILSTLPSFAARISKYLVKSHKLEHRNWLKLRGTADLFLLLNHALNFVFYAATSTVYRQYVVDLVCCRNRAALDKESAMSSAHTMSLRLRTTNSSSNNKSYELVASQPANMT